MLCRLKKATRILLRQVNVIPVKAGIQSRSGCPRLNPCRGRLIPFGMTMLVSYVAGLTVSVFMASTAAYGQEVSREQIKGLDEQVQEIKTDVLSIAAELNQLEEKLLYPSNTQVAVFVSLAKGETFRLDSVEIQLDGKPVAHYIYTFKELEALQKGGVQRIYTGNIRSGEHDLQVSVAGKSSGGTEFHKTESFKIRKGVGPKIVELSLRNRGILLKDG